jgi:hypothetical protein
MKSSKRIFAALELLIASTSFAESQTCTEISNNPGQKADKTLNVIQSGEQYSLPLNMGHLSKYLLKVIAGRQIYVTKLLSIISTSGRSLIPVGLFY